MNEKSSPKTVTLDRINSQSGKAEEIAFLEKVAKSIPEGTYLKDLFSKTLIDWTAWRINNDWTCPIMVLYNDEIETHNRDNTHHINEIKRLTKSLDDIKVTMEIKQDFLNQANNVNRDLNDLLASAQNALIQEREEHAENYAAWYAKGNKLVEENLAMDSEIIKLKAKLYDLEHKEDK